MFDIEDTFLVALLPPDAPRRHWLYHWAASYPLAVEVLLPAAEPAVQAQRIRRAVDGIAGSLIFAAHDSACAAFVHWAFQAALSEQKMVAGAILAAPRMADWSSDPADILNRTRLHFPAVLTATADDPLCPQDWAYAAAKRLSARYLPSPGSGHLDNCCDNWQWGMRLMQEILLG